MMHGGGHHHVLYPACGQAGHGHMLVDAMLDQWFMSHQR